MSPGPLPPGLPCGSSWMLGGGRGSTTRYCTTSLGGLTSRGYEKGEAPHSADPTGNTLRMGSVTHYQDGDSVLNKHTSNPLRASTSLHSKNLLSHARLTQPPTVYLNPWGEGVNPSGYITCQTGSPRLGRRRAAAGGRQRVAELSPLGHAMPADPPRGPEPGLRQRARLGWPARARRRRSSAPATRTRASR